MLYELRRVDVDRVAMEQKLTIYRCGDWQVFPQQLEIHVGERVHRLALKPMLVLLRLLKDQGQVVSRQQLIDEVWEGNSYVAPRGINNAIWQLRKVLGTSPLNIETVPKQGYRLLSAERIHVEQSQAISEEIVASQKVQNHYLLVFPAVIALIIICIVYFKTETKLTTIKPLSLIHI